MPFNNAFTPNFFRVSDDAFVPKSMIDTLFDYTTFLDAAQQNGAIGSCPTSPKSIGIIGAGAAGLAAAYELSKINGVSKNQNLSVVLYEASSRPGGRMYSITYPNPPYKPKIFEMGCMRFPKTSYTLFHYLKIFNLQTNGAFPDPSKVPTLLYYQNQVIKWRVGSQTPEQDDFKRIGKDFNNMLIYALGNVNSPDIKNPTSLFDYWSLYQTTPSTENKQAVINAWQKIIDTYKDTTYYKAVFDLGQMSPEIVTKKWTVEDMNKFGALGVGSGGFGPLYEVNFVEILRLFTNAWESNQQFLETGISTLANDLLKHFTEQGGSYCNELGAKGVKIKPYGGFEVYLSNGQIAQHDAVIVATTTRAMEFMGLTLGPDALVSQGAKVAMRKLHLMNSSKLFVTTKTKFWYKENNGEADLPQNIQGDEAFRGLYCLNYDENEGGDRVTEGMGVVLISYVWGDDSSKLLALTEVERFDLFLSALNKIDSKFTSLLRQEAVEMQKIDWEDESLFYGAFKLDYPGQEQACHDGYFQYQQEGNSLIMAGDSVSWAGGWVEGALTSGINAACAALYAVGGNVIDGSPLTLSADMYSYDKLPSASDTMERPIDVKKPAQMKKPVDESQNTAC